MDIKSKENLTGDLSQHMNKKGLTSHVVTIIVSVAVIAGLIGGVFGVMVFDPWYERVILGIDPAEQNSRKIILDEESAIISAVEEVNSAVVSIVVTKDLPQFEQFGSPFGEFFFSVPSGEVERQQVGAGSGFIISEDGMIVTNKHVVNDTEAEYTAVTNDNQRYPATVIATDPFNDLAIVKIEASGLHTVSLGDSNSLKLGQKVIAIGNALGKFQNTVTSGVVSGIGRNITASGGGVQSETLSEVIQTDAAINPGNSGGPLVNLAGEVVGVNTAVSQSAQLIGFAIPINQVKKVIDDVSQFGKVRRPFLGVRYTILTESIARANNLPVSEGAWIIQGANAQEPAVIPGSPADLVGLKSGDIILEIDGEKITAERQLADILRKYNPGDRVILEVLKADGTQTTLSVTLGEAQ